MNPKDMTNKQLLLQAVADIQKARREFMEEDVPCIGVPKDSCDAELLRRLDEADALRKENEALRKDKERIDFLDDGNYGIDPRSIPGVTMNGRRFHCLAGRGDWSSLRDAIDAARLAKESEASHE